MAAQQAVRAREDVVEPADATGAARGFAEFVACLRASDIPEEVRERAKLFILDAVGCALAANAYPFAERTLAGVTELGGEGRCSVIGRSVRLPPRDAALINGVLLHGLDLDDTHLTAIIHPTVTCLSAALAIAEQRALHGADLLTAYVAAMESSIRIGVAVKGGFHHVGFHATGLISHFASALAAGRLLGLDASALVSAQGLAASTAAGCQVFLEEGAWSKRLHPGWGAAAGITTATLAKNGFFGPSRPYEGRFGFFDTYLQGYASEVDRAALDDGLGTRWELVETSVKPYPVCHFIHGAAEAAIEIRRELGDLRPEDIAEVSVVVPRDTVPIVVEPIEVKTNPANDYDAKFSAQFVVATCLLRGRFGLAELTETALRDPQVRGLARRVVCGADPESRFPKYMSGGVRVKLRDGRERTLHIPVNKGSGRRSLSAADISDKFFGSAELTVSRDKAQRIQDAVLGVDRYDVASLCTALRAE